MDPYLDRNRSLWDGWAALHLASPSYDVAGFRAGASSLKEIEIEAVGNVSGLDLLHLQCHFGLDTLSWARRGARVTGVDFSEKAIASARGIAADLDIAADFLRAEVTQLPGEWSGRFDLVFSSYGVLSWIPDLAPWATTIHRVLRPGASFHLVEFHPFAMMLGDDGRFAHPYFHSDAPQRAEVTGSYASADTSFSHESFEWAHSLSDVFTSLTSAGLEVSELQEYPYSPWGFPFLRETTPGRWTVRDSPVDLPLVFSLRATKPRADR
jgi:SAM-dependent methyltransferase